MHVRIFVTLTIMALSGAATAQTLNDFPSKEEPLNVRIDKFEKLLRANHWNEGTILPHVIFPPAGQPTPFVGNQEDCPVNSGQYLAALSFKFAVTKDPEVRQLADEVLAGILKLEQVTGVPGCVARSFNKTEQAGWDEQAFFYPLEWHASTAMPGYRWLGDISQDQMTWMMFGLANYIELCADDEHRKTVASFVDRVMTRIVENNFRIVDSDGKMTLWGNFCPDLQHENLSALLILSLLRSAATITDSQAYQAAYQRLITKYHYDDQAILAKVLYPVEWRHHGDDSNAAAALYDVMRMEKDENTLRKYRMSLNRHWCTWKDGAEPFYPMLYQVLTKEQVVSEPVVAAIKGLWAGDRTKGMFSIPSEAGPQQVESEQEQLSTLVIMTYWFGRYHELIDGAW